MNIDAINPRLVRTVTGFAEIYRDCWTENQRQKTIYSLLDFFDSIHNPDEADYMSLFDELRSEI